MNEAERIDVGELRQDASRYVEMAKAGRRIAVRDRGELVAYTHGLPTAASPV